ncbi:MAG: hypothetical protein WBI94_00965 [Candidatus Cloacimonadaceae bacterium]
MWWGWGERSSLVAGACQSADPATSIRIYIKSTRIYKTSNYISVRYASNGAASPL